MRIVFAADHAGYQLKDQLRDYVASTFPHAELTDLGTNSGESVDYPDYGRTAAQAVAEGKADYGILVCGTGIGISIAANRIPGARCAQASEPTSARLAREHNDANLIALGARLTGVVIAQDCVQTFLTTAFGGERHQPRVDKLG